MQAEVIIATQIFIYYPDSWEVTLCGALLTKFVPPKLRLQVRVLIAQACKELTAKLIFQRLLESNEANQSNAS